MQIDRQQAELSGRQGLTPQIATTRPMFIAFARDFAKSVIARELFEYSNRSEVK